MPGRPQKMTVFKSSEKRPVQSQDIKAPEVGEETSLTKHDFQNLTPSNVLLAQRTLGNQAVMRLIRQQKTGSTLPAKSPARVVQREVEINAIVLGMTVSDKTNRNKSSWYYIKHFYKAYKNAKDIESKLDALISLDGHCRAWAQKAQTASRTSRSLHTTRQQVVNSLQKQMATELPKLHVAARLGLAESYINELDMATMQAMVNADKALKSGDLGRADQELKIIKAAAPGPYPLIKSALVHRNIATVNPALGSLIGNENFKQKDAEMINAGKQHHASNSTDNDLAGSIGQSIRHFRKNVTTPPRQDNADKKNRREWEQQNIDVKHYENLKPHEQFAIQAYTQAFFDKINPELRKGVLPEGQAPGAQAAPGAQPPTSFGKGSLGYTQNAISGLNKLPPYQGSVYRHDSLFPGFHEINRVGAVVSDLAFLSTTREANTLQAVAGSGPPEVISIIKSRTGRFIKPLSQFDLQYENEVLFKPGARFKITKVVKLAPGPDGNPRWPSSMDAEMVNVLNQDREKATIKVILVKEEI